MQGVRHSFVVAERLEQFDRETLVFAHRAQVPGRAGEVREIGFEQLDPVEARSGDGVDLVRERAAQGNGGDGTAHGLERLDGVGTG